MLAQRFGFEDVPALTPRYNICPSQPVTAVLPDPAANALALRILRWGLIPPWNRDPAAGAQMFNARSETVADKPAFRDAFSSRRCLIPVDGFFEWRKQHGRKQPYFFCRPDRRIIALAGLWERWEYAGNQLIESCSILTTDRKSVV